MFPLHWSEVRSLSTQAAGVLVSFPLAQTGEGIKECELVQWFVKEGETVEAFQPLCEVQSDKASIEITSKYTGSITKLHAAPGDLVKVGAALLDLRVTDDSQLDPADRAAAQKAAFAEASQQASSAPGAAASSGDEAPAGVAAEEAREILASPAIRRLAREHNIDLPSVKGTGDRGRILREDIEGVIASLASSLPLPPPPQTPKPAAPTPPESRPATPFAEAAQQLTTPTMGASVAGAPLPPVRVPIKGYRRTMVKTSTEAGSLPMFYYFDEVHMDGLMAARALLRADPVLAGAKLTYLPFVIKALGIALDKHPGMGAQISREQTELLTPRSFNIGVAMATPGGLVVPNVKQVECKSIVQIAQELAQLQQLAAAGKLEARHVTGGTLTISNIGTVGGANATPLVNPPESAIVALGRVKPVPAFAGPHSDTVVRRHTMAISWGADHRVVDGASVAEFSNTWKALLEQPLRLLLHMA